MSRDLFERAKAVFVQVYDATPEDRDALITRACEGDPDLCEEVRRLLVYHEQSGGLGPVDDLVLGVRDRRDPASFRDGASAEADAGTPALPARLGRFEIRSLLGRGAMGIVYRAFDPSTGHEIALKVVREGASSRSLLGRQKVEAEALRRLHHPGIARLLEVGSLEDEGEARPYLCVEMVHGRSLRDFRFPSSRADDRGRIELLAAICDAVEHAHRQGIVHRDLKPEHVMVEEMTGQPKILDFGIARLTGIDARATTVMTRAGQIVGTLRYMSPEQARGDSRAIGARTDVHALGLIGYELLTGRLPYDLPPEIGPALAAIQTARRVPARSARSELEPGLEAILDEALRIPVEDRYDSAAAMAQDLRLVLAGRKPKARGSRWFSVLARRARARRKVAAAALALAIAVSAAAVLDLPARFTSSGSDESRVAQRMQQAEALLVEGDRLRHSEDFTREHMVDALRAFDRAKQIVLDTTPQRYTPALLRFIDWRRGECWYFLGELESDPRGFESARECWRTANSYPFDSRILASLDPQSPTFRRLRDLWRGQAISGLGLVESKLGEFRNPARHLRVAVWSHRIAYEAALDSTAFVPIAGRHAIQQERIRFARNDLAGSLLRLGATIDSICHIDEAIRICAETERTRMFPADPSAHASCLHNWGLALLERAERNGSAEDLAGAQERFVQAIQVREAGAARVRHTASHRELARALALQARRETDARARSRGFAQAESLLWRGLDSLPEDRRTSIAGFQRATAAALIDRVARDAADASQTLGQDAVHAASLDGRPASFVDRGLVLADSLLTEASARVDAGDAPARMAWIEFERGRLARVRSWVVQEQAVRGHGGDSAVTEATATKGDGFPQPAVNALGAASAFREEALRHFELADDLLPEPQHPALHRMILGEMRLLD